MLRVVGLLALALLVVAKPKAGNSPQELSDIADRLKDAKDDPEKAKQALNMMDPDSLGDSMANMMVMAMDKDQDGILTKEEINSIPMPEDDGTKGKSQEMFNNMDADGDGIVTRAEAKAYFAQLGNTLKGLGGMMGGSKKKTDL